MKFKGFKDFTTLEHGGDTRAGKRKTARPVATKRPMHVVLRASRARGSWSMLRRQHHMRIDALVHMLARNFGVRVHQYANAGNHIHLLIQAKTRKGFQSYLRTLAGLIARTVTGAKKGNSTGKFWDRLAYSRVVEWGRGLRTAARYVFQNTLETFGLSTKRKPALSAASPPRGVS